MIGYALLAGYQILSGLQQAEITRRSAEINKEIADINSQYAEIDAHNAEIAGFSRAARYEAIADASLAAQKVAMNVQDVDVNFGTAAQIRDESKLNKFLNQLDIKNQAHQAALGYKNQSRTFRLQGQAIETQGDLNARTQEVQGVVGAARTYGGYSLRNSKTEET